MILSDIKGRISRTLLRREIIKEIETRSCILIEVGAHTGDDFLIKKCQKKGSRFYMFEPHPQAFQKLMDKIKKIGGEHTIAFNQAISDYNGRAKFYISNYDVCSSLNKFEPSANQTWEDNLGKSGFHTIREFEVDVVRLDAFMKDHQIPHIDFLEIDAQGEDLRVIKSLGENIYNCKRIQTETCVYKHPLYEKQFKKKEMMDYLSKHDFITERSWKQSLGREENIVFVNRHHHP